MLYLYLAPVFTAPVFTLYLHVFTAPLSQIHVSGKPRPDRGPSDPFRPTTPLARMRGTTRGCCSSTRECREMETHPMIQGTRDGHLSLSNQPLPPQPHTRMTASAVWRMHDRRLRRLRRLHPGLGTPVRAGASMLCKYSCIVFTL